MKEILTAVIIVLSIYLFGFILYMLETNKSNKQHIHLAPLRVYQIEIESTDTFSVWDGNRLVGKCFLTDDSEIGNLIIYDQK